jgi:hypothetical protein
MLQLEWLTNGNSYVMFNRSGKSGAIGHFSTAVLPLDQKARSALRAGTDVELPLLVVDSLGHHLTDDRVEQIKGVVVDHLLQRVCPDGTPRDAVRLQVFSAKGLQDDGYSCGAFAALYASRIALECSRSASMSASTDWQALASRVALEVTPALVAQARGQFR